jgi:hypothetical protein
VKTLSWLRLAATALIACGLLAGLSAFIHPPGQIRAADLASEPLLQSADASPAVLALMERSCGNCHSEKTKWPWYSYIPPVSSIIENDVITARQHMNLSVWQAYTSARQIEILSEIAPLVRNHIMPPKRYLALHPEAKLTDVEIGQIITWAHKERRGLTEIQSDDDLTR